jgi:DNA-binding response OmpR family regulator
MQNSQPSAPAPLRILLCDDFVEIRELLATMLRRDGFEVDAASDGACGWEAFCARHYDLLITDNDMPLLTGLDFVRRVRAIPHHLPVIVISGFARWDDADVKLLLEPGAFIEKPFAFPVLRPKVEELMNGKPANGGGSAPAELQQLPLQPEHRLHRDGAIAVRPSADVKLPSGSATASDD